ncbi:hypothetical protein ABZ128_10975 [Streptomyces sp. NPDC006326]|uniref:hypothetical protein n=1 Tax=Streptomyces sp. NPDC006326 TaxID=3156752 RepID=UPI0033B47E18
MTGTTRYSEPDTSSREFDISFRDEDNVTQSDRQNAERSVAALVARAKEAAARDRAAEAGLVELTDPLNAPFKKLVEEDPHAVKALEKLRDYELLQPDTTEALQQDAPPTAYDVSPRAESGFAPPYDFDWSFHIDHPPFRKSHDRFTGMLSLDARSGAITDGAPGRVIAHAGFGVFMVFENPGKKFPHAVLKPGSFAFHVQTVGVGSNATSEGGFDLAVFEDGRFLTGASRRLWRSRISGFEEAEGRDGPLTITAPDVEFNLRPGHGYSVNAGIWVVTDRSTGVGAGAAWSQIAAKMTRMWLFS